MLDGAEVTSLAGIRGIQQGRPLSPSRSALSSYLFISVMARRCRVSLFRPTTIMVAAYAEGIALPLRNTASLEGALITLALYQNISGRRVNLLKLKTLRFSDFADSISVVHVYPTMLLCVVNDASGTA